MCVPYERANIGIKHGHKHPRCNNDDIQNQDVEETVRQCNIHKSNAIPYTTKYDTAETDMTTKWWWNHCVIYLVLPGVAIPKDLAHHLHPHQVSQQRVDRDHLKQQKCPSYKHRHITAGEII